MLKDIPSAESTQVIAQNLDQALLRKLEVRRFGEKTARASRGRQLPGGLSYTARWREERDEQLEAEAKIEDGDTESSISDHSEEEEEEEVVQPSRQKRRPLFTSSSSSGSEDEEEAESGNKEKIISILIPAGYRYLYFSNKTLSLIFNFF